MDASFFVSVFSSPLITVFMPLLFRCTTHAIAFKTLVFIQLQCCMCLCKAAPQMHTHCYVLRTRLRSNQPQQKTNGQCQLKTRALSQSTTSVTWFEVFGCPIWHNKFNRSAIHRIFRFLGPHSNGKLDSRTKIGKTGKQKRSYLSSNDIFERRVIFISVLKNNFF